MTLIEHFGNLSFLPPQENSTRRKIYSAMVYKESILYIILDFFIFLLNLGSILIVYFAFLRNKNVLENSLYKSIHEAVGWYSICDAIVICIFWVIYGLKLCTCSSQTDLELRIRHDSLLANMPPTVRKVASFALKPRRIFELITISYLIVLLLPFDVIKKNFQIFLKISVYFRCLKMGIYTNAGRIFIKILFRGKKLLLELLFLVFLLVFLLGFSVFIFEGVKSKVDNESGSETFDSINDGIWWAISTITSTGFGDYYPSTSGGRVVGVITMLVGALYLAMPLCIINNVFEQFIIEERVRKKNLNTEIQDKLATRKFDVNDQKLLKFPAKPAKSRKMGPQKESCTIKNDQKNSSMSRKEDNGEKNETEEEFQTDLENQTVGGESSKYYYLEAKLDRLERMIKSQYDILDGMKDMRAYVLYSLKKEKLCGRMLLPVAKKKGSDREDTEEPEGLANIFNRANTSDIP